MSITEIKKMTVDERLTAMEQIWDSLCHEESSPKSPSWHQAILDEISDYQTTDAIGRPIENLLLE